MLLGPVNGKKRLEFSSVFFFIGVKMIDFKTYEEQIEILKNRGMTIPNENFAKNKLQQNNYYNLINGYKEPFLQIGITPEQYVKGMSFNEIYALQQFDKELRLNLSRFLILVERTFASILSHEFSRNYKNHDLDYLNIDNYNTKTYYDKTTQTTVLQSSLLISELNRVLQTAISHNDKMICHYYSHYGRIPLWVFINQLSFGTISKMYKQFLSRERDAIAINLSKISEIQLFANDIENSLTILVLLRNKCAHDQRIYDFNPSPMSIKPNAFLKKFFPLSNNISSLFGAISCMSIFLKPNVFSSLIKTVRKQISQLFTQIHSIPTQFILDKMGIPQSFLGK